MKHFDVTVVAFYSDPIIGAVKKSRLGGCYLNIRHVRFLQQEYIWFFNGAGFFKGGSRQARIDLENSWRNVCLTPCSTHECP
jgi:hypothetical protein